MNELTSNNNIFLRYGISFLLGILCLFIIFVLNIVEVNRFDSLQVVKLNETSYLAIFQSKASGSMINLNDHIILQKGNIDLKFNVDSISKSSNLLYLKLLQKEFLPSYFNAKLNSGNDKLWNIVFKW